MADAEAATSAAAPTSPKKSAKGKTSASSKKPRVKPSHPKTADMVNAAIKDLRDRGGSSLQAIKKYIASNYKVDAEKQAPFIRKYLKAAVTTGSLVQTKGKGASGSFKLAVPGPNEKPAKESKKGKSQKPKKGKPSVKKVASPKKAAAKKPSTPKKAAPKPKTTSPKAKTAAKSPTKKPKAPKPKKTTASKAKSPKKAAAKKK